MKYLYFILSILLLYGYGMFHGALTYDFYGYIYLPIGFLFVGIFGLAGAIVSVLLEDRK